MPAIPTLPLDPSVDPAVIAKNNAEVIAKVASQDAAGQTNVPSLEDVGNTKAALAALRADKKKEEDQDPPVVPVTAPPPAPDPGTPAPAPAPPTESAEQKAAREKAEAEQVEKHAEEKKLADEIFKGAPTLPPNASVKSSDAFNAIKSRAAQEIRARDQQLLEARSKIDELSKAASKPLTDEVEKELTELREFRAKLDVDLDPKFKSFDTKLTAAHAFVYAQLKRSPNITAEVIEKIKQLGGPDQVKMEPILETVGDPVIRRLVEAKLAEVEMIRYEKESAVEAAKSNVKEYMTAREQELTAGGHQHTVATKEHLTGLLSKVSWMQPVPVDPKASKEDQKKAQDHNAYATQISAEVEGALQDDSPNMRATLLVGMAQLFRLQNVHEAVSKDYARLTKELEQANETIKRLKTPAQSRLAGSAAPAAGARPGAAPEINYNETAKEAMQRMRKAKLTAEAAA